MNHSHIVRTAVVFGLLAVLAAAVRVEAQNLSGDLTSIDGPNLNTTLCTPIVVGEFNNRIHVRCSVPVSGIVYFAVATSDANRAARHLALWSTALVTGRDLRIYYDPANTSGVSIGCGASDCRLADWSELL